MTATDRTSRRLTWLLFGSIAAILCLHLHVHWLENPQYSYGALVPLLAAFLLYRRWESRPAPLPPRSQPWTWLALATAVLFLPLWLVAQPNPDWRLLSWLLLADLLALAMCGWMIAGGWPWVKHFAFPTCFIASAVPLPHGMEAPVIQSLMEFVAALTVGVVNLMGIPAMQHGNVIEIGSGLLGIDEACSGVRSLQAALMAALFLGELYWLDLSRRISLILAAVGVAVATNIVRAFFLTWQSARNGIAAADQWHDPAGFSIMTGCFVALWGIARLMDPDAPPELSRDSAPPRAIPSSLLLSLAGWFLVVVIGTELWFRSSGPAPLPQWTFTWPTERDEFHQATITPEAASLLRYDSGSGGGWKDDSGSEWLAFNFTWAPGPARSRLLARMHRPENCLPAAGWRLMHVGEPLSVAVGSITIPFRRMTFQYGNQTARIWYCIWEERRNPLASSPEPTASAQRAGIEAVLQRERHLGQQVLQVVRFGNIAEDAANAEFLSQIAPLLKQRRDVSPE